MKRIISLIFATIIFGSVFITPASALNAYDTDFGIFITSGRVPDTGLVRKKDDSSSSYVNYQTRSDGRPASGVNRFEALIYGADRGDSTEYTDCTTVIYGTSMRRPKAIVTKGTRGFVYQEVHERFGDLAWAELTGRRVAYTDPEGTAFGCWSPDSIWEDLTVYNG